MKTSNIISLLSAALLTGALLLFAGCEKKTNMMNEDLSTIEKKLIGTWVSCGFSTFSEDPYCGCHYGNMSYLEIDTITFHANHYILDNFEYGLSDFKYYLSSDSTILIKRDSNDLSLHFHFKFTDNYSHLIIYNWRHRDFANYVYDVCLTKLE